jgi:DNA repair protein RadC
VLCVHNHPSGDPAPSAADVQVTRQLREAAKAVDIELLDHVIVGRPASDPAGRGYYSFRESGVI